MTSRTVLPCVQAKTSVTLIASSCSFKSSGFLIQLIAFPSAHKEKVLKVSSKQRYTVIKSSLFFFVQHLLLSELLCEPLGTVFESSALFLKCCVGRFLHLICWPIYVKLLYAEEKKSNNRRAEDLSFHLQSPSQKNGLIKWKVRL